MTNTSETKAVASKKSVDVFIDVANASLDLVYALVAAANKARRDRIREAAAATATIVSLRNVRSQTMFSGMGGRHRNIERGSSSNNFPESGAS